MTNHLVSYKGKKDKINAQNFQMGNKKAIALCKALSLTECQKVNLKCNRLNSNTGKVILESINSNVQYLNLEKNSLGGRDNTFI